MGAEIVDIGSVVGTFVRENGERSKCLVSGQEVEKERIKYVSIKERKTELSWPKRRKTIML